MPSNTKPTMHTALAADWRAKQGNYLRALRLGAGLRQADVATVVGISLKAISLIETGRMFLPPERVKAYATALDVDLKTLSSAMLKYSNPWLWVGIFPNKDSRLEKALERQTKRVPETIRRPVSHC